MNWTSVREDTLARIRSSRLRVPIKSPYSAMGASSLEDFVHEAIEDFICECSLGKRNLHMLSHDEVVGILAKKALAKYERQRKAVARRSDLVRRYSYNVFGLSCGHQERGLCAKLLDILKDDEISKKIILAAVDGLCDFSDAQGLSDLIEVPVQQIEIAKKRIRRKAKSVIVSYDETPDRES